MSTQKRLAEYGNKMESKKNGIGWQIVLIKDSIDEINQKIGDLDARIKMIEDTVVDWGKFRIVNGEQQAIQHNP